MKIISFVAQKGGSGKTTLTLNFAVVATQDGVKTLIIDLDPQKTATQWWESRDAETPVLIHVNYNELDKALVLATQKGYELVLIDTAGRDDLMNTKATSVSDFCIIPCQPSMEDMRAQALTVELVKRQRKPAAFILTRCGPRGSKPNSARRGLAVFGLPVASSHTVNRTAYPDAYALSLSVVEYEPDGKAAKEIGKLWEWLKLKMDRLAA